MTDDDFESDLEELSSAEDFLEYFRVDYDPKVVQVNRLHILQRFHNYLAEVDEQPDAVAARWALHADLLGAAYRDFVVSDAQTEKLFRVFHLNEPKTASIPLSDLLGQIPVLPEFEFGTQVRVLRNVRNDGTFPGQATGTLLVRRGSTGYVRDVGTFLQDQIIYTVHFLDEDRLVGCREEELQLAADPWVPSRFEARDRVRARVPLGIQGRVLVAPGGEGEVMKVIRDAPDGVAYHVHFDGASTLQVPETALDGPAADDA